MPRPRLWTDEVQFGLAISHSTTSHPYRGNTVNVGTLLNVWSIMAGYGGI